MDFTTAAATPISITINGTAYNLPRFLLPQMKAWAAERQKKIADIATEHLSKDEKARLLMFFQPPPIDIFELAKYARSPEGTSEFVDLQMKAGGVPDELRAAVLTNGDPVTLAALADKLASASVASSGAASMTESGADPLAKPPGELDGSPGVGATNSPNSTPSTLG